MNALLQQFTAVIRRSPLASISLILLPILAVANYFLWDRQQVLTQQHTEVRRSGEAVMLSLVGQARISAQLASVKDALAYLDKNLVVESDLENSNYFYQMETLSHVRLGRLNQLSSQPAEDGNPYKAIPFSLRATGSFTQLMNFLRAIESGPRLLRIRSFAFSRNDAKTNGLALELTVELLGSP